MLMGDQRQEIPDFSTADAAAQWNTRSDREKAARDALSKHPGITIAALVNTSNEPQQIFAAGNHRKSAMFANLDTTGTHPRSTSCSFPAIGQVTRTQQPDRQNPWSASGSSSAEPGADPISGFCQPRSLRTHNARGTIPVLVLNEIYAQGKMPGRTPILASRSSTSPTIERQHPAE